MKKKAAFLGLVISSICVSAYAYFSSLNNNQTKADKIVFPGEQNIQTVVINETTIPENPDFDADFSVFADEDSYVNIHFSLFKAGQDFTGKELPVTFGNGVFAAMRMPSSFTNLATILTFDVHGATSISWTFANVNSVMVTTYDENDNIFINETYDQTEPGHQTSCNLYDTVDGNERICSKVRLWIPFRSSGITTTIDEIQLSYAVDSCRDLLN